MQLMILNATFRALCDMSDLKSLASKRSAVGQIDETSNIPTAQNRYALER